MLRIANSGSLFRADKGALESSTPTTNLTAEASKSTLMTPSSSDTTKMKTLPLATISASTVMVCSMYTQERDWENSFGITQMELQKSVILVSD